MMFRRSLPSFPDLAAFLGHLQAKGDVADIAAPVDTHLELTELHRRVIGQGGPVLRVANPTVQGAPAKLPIVTNLFGTRARVAAGLGTDDAGLTALGEFMAFLRSPRPPESIAEAGKLWPVARAALNARPRVVADATRWRDDLTRLSDLPVQTCWPGDIAPLVTWGLVVTRAPGPDAFATYNLGVYRLQLVDDGRLLMRWLPMRGGAQHHRMWAKTGEPTPAAIVIGADPATILASVMPAPEGVTELAIAGIVGAARPRLLPCRTIPLHVPASADIVLEGTVSHTETLPEGPYGDHTGYYNPPEPFPVFNLSAMRVRDGAPYLTTFTGRAPDEPAVMAEALSDVFKPLLRQQLPEVLDLYLPPETCSYRVAILSIDKRYPGQARRVMMGFWSLLPQFSMTKLVIVVDGDIDIRSWSDVMWAVATRSDASRDLMTVDRTPIDHLDFAAPIEGLGGKLGIDATTKIGTETDRTWGTVMTMDKAVAARVDQRWSEFFPTIGPTRTP